MEVQTDPPPPPQTTSPWLCLRKTPQGKSLSPRVATQNMQLHTEASGKRSREVSSTQTTPHGTCPLSLGYGGRCPSPALRDADGCEASAGRPGSQPTAGLRPQANTGVAGERRGDGNNLCQSCVRANARFGRLRIDDAADTDRAPDRSATLSEETPQRSPAIAPSDQNRSRQCISWKGDDPPLMGPRRHLHSHRLSVDDSVPCPQRASPLLSRRLSCLFCHQSAQRWKPALSKSALQLRINSFITALNSMSSSLPMTTQMIFQWSEESRD